MRKWRDCTCSHLWHRYSVTFNHIMVALCVDNVFRTRNQSIFQTHVVAYLLLTLPEHLSSPPVFSGVRVTRSLVLCVYFVDRCLSFCPFSFGHCVVCSSLIYRFWLSLLYLQTLLSEHINLRKRNGHINILNVIIGRAHGVNWDKGKHLFDTVSIEMYWILITVDDDFYGVHAPVISSFKSLHSLRHIKMMCH